MMKYVVLAFLVTLAFAQSGTGPTRAPPTPCQMCNFIIGQAIHHVGTRVGNEAQLMMALVKECESLSRQGNAVVNQCVNFVSANIQTIFTEVQANKRASEICSDLKQC